MLLPQQKPFCQTRSILTKKFPLKEKTAFRKKLLSWYYQYQRKLPWRESPSLYKTVVSEFMLQQTKVDTVLPYFDRWIKCFPDFESLSKANEEKVVKQWEGLGYYSRACNLHKLAQQLMKQKSTPSMVNEWLTFPGVGPYTAAAISSIHFKNKAAVIDGNVIRILTRITADNRSFKNNTEAVKHLTPLADDLLDEEYPGDYNQAIMELGATVCFRRKPLCTVCPVETLCTSKRLGEEENYPKILRKKIYHSAVERLWIENEKSILFKHIPEKARRLANHYELPEAQMIMQISSQKVLTKKLLLKKTRYISNEKIEEKIYRFFPDEKVFQKINNEKTFHWVEKKALDTILLSGPHRRWIKQILENQNN